MNQYEWLSKLFNINMNCLPEKAKLLILIYSNYISLKNNHKPKTYVTCNEKNGKNL